MRNNAEAILWLDPWLGWKLLKHLEQVLIEPDQRETRDRD